MVTEPAKVMARFKSSFLIIFNSENGRGRSRTCDYPLRRRMLYPTELRAQGSFMILFRFNPLLGFIPTPNYLSPWNNLKQASNGFFLFYRIAREPYLVFKYLGNP
jgi:hypothetical protein